MMIQTALAAIGPDCDPADDIADCTVTPVFTSLQVGNGNNPPEDGDLKIAGGKIYTGGESGWDFTDISGYELTHLGDDDFISTNDIFVDNAAFIDGWIWGGRYILTTATDDNGNGDGDDDGGIPSLDYDDGDIVATDDLGADDSIIADGGTIRTGTPSSYYSNGDIISTRNLVADGDIIGADDITASNDIIAYDTILAGSSIGRYYYLSDFSLADSGGNDYATVICGLNDILVSCTGGIDDNNGRYQGVSMMNARTCSVAGNNGGQVGDSTKVLNVWATCFSPDGVVGDGWTGDFDQPFVRNWED